MAENKDVRYRSAHTPTYITKIYLKMTPEEEAFLDKLLVMCIGIYNYALNMARKMVNRLLNSSEYHALIYKKKKSKEDYARMRELEEAEGYSEYDLHQSCLPIKDHFRGAIGARLYQKLVTRAFRAAEKLRKGEAKHLNEVRTTYDFYVENKENFRDLMIKEIAGSLFVQWNGRRIMIPINPDDKLIMQSLNDRIKYAGIGRVKIRGKFRYYVIIAREGRTPNAWKYMPKKNIRGNVGIDIGPATAMISAEKLVKMYSLAPEDLPKIEEEIARMQEFLDSSRRATNPWNYNPDGTIKKYKDRKPWVYSKRYLHVLRKIKELRRVRIILRNQYKNSIMNRALRAGRNIIVEKMSFKGLQARAKKTTINEKTGLPNSKGRFGKSIGNNAPSGFLSRMKLKVEATNIPGYERHFIEANTGKIKASQYNHITGKCEKPKKEKAKKGEKKKEKKNPYDGLEIRWRDIGGFLVQRDLYSAFLLMCVSLDGNRIVWWKTRLKFMKFLKLHDAEIRRVKRQGKDSPLAWYVADKKQSRKTA